MVWDICKLGPHGAALFLSCSTLPGSVTPNFPTVSASPPSASPRPRWECILGPAMSSAPASLGRVHVRGGGTGGGLWLVGMEIVFPSLEHWPYVGAAQILPDTEGCKELWGVRIARAGFRWRFVERSQASFSLRSKGQGGNDLPTKGKRGIWLLAQNTAQDMSD